MARYIDADKVIEVIVNTPSMVGSKYDFDHNVLTALVDREHEVVDLINNNVPTADVAPVTHALWIYKSVDDNDNGEYTCSRCGCGEVHSISCEVPYCWRCGAKMDGVIYNE